MQGRLPLHEAGSGNGQALGILQIDLRPRTPIAVGIVDVATARKEIEISRSAYFRSSPLRKAAGIEDIAFVGTLLLPAGTQHKELAQICGYGVDRAIPGSRH